ncbi:YlzJ-like family protein [Paenibacillus cisolokensis]|uniref:YlzJ-like family protein n=1 Tax=Paenibacillus cisolokensis TaxID=1658519 RepID=UPI003D2BF520
MTLHTTMPLELVLDGVNGPGRPTMQVKAGGLLLEVEPVAPGVGRIVRLLDCELSDYLKPELSPGSIIAYGSAPDAK